MCKAATQIKWKGNCTETALKANKELTASHGGGTFSELNHQQLRAQVFQ